MFNLETMKSKGKHLSLGTSESVIMNIKYMNQLRPIMTGPYV